MEGTVQTYSQSLGKMLSKSVIVSIARSGSTSTLHQLSRAASHSASPRRATGPAASVTRSVLALQNAPFLTQQSCIPPREQALIDLSALSRGALQGWSYSRFLLRLIILLGCMMIAIVGNQGLRKVQ